MKEFLQIRNKNQLFEDFVIAGLKEHVSKHDIRLNLIDAIRKEVFGQMTGRMKVTDLQDALQTPENEKIVKNISIQTRKKWEALVKECNKWRETAGLISANDLREVWNEEEEPDEGTDAYIDEGSQEWTEEELANEEMIVTGQMSVSDELPVAPGQEYPPGYWLQRA